MPAPTDQLHSRPGRCLAPGLRHTIDRREQRRPSAVMIRVTNNRPDLDDAEGTATPAQGTVFVPQSLCDPNTGTAQPFKCLGSPALDHDHRTLNCLRRRRFIAIRQQRNTFRPDQPPGGTSPAHLGITGEHAQRCALALGCDSQPGIPMDPTGTRLPVNPRRFAPDDHRVRGHASPEWSTNGLGDRAR